MPSLKALLTTLILLFCTNATTAATSLKNLNGDEIALSSLKGKWVFINYWASWCQPCLDEIPMLNHFYEMHKAENIAVFAVNYDALPDNKQERLIKKFNIQYPSLRRNSIDALQLGPVSVVPVTFVLNPQGELSTTLYGGQTLDDLNEAMASIS